MRDIKSLIILILCGIIASLVFILKKQQELHMVLAVSHRELERWLNRNRKAE